MYVYTYTYTYIYIYIYYRWREREREREMFTWYDMCKSHPAAILADDTPPGRGMQRGKSLPAACPRECSGWFSPMKSEPPTPTPEI